MTRITRRRFLERSAAASTVFSTFAIAGTKASGRVLGANDTVRIGVAGVNGRGRAHIEGYAAVDNVQITHLIDPDERILAGRSDMVKSLTGNTPKALTDVRRALDDKDLDAISIATPNHWHSLIAIWACQAGKDVYVEKPISHNVSEGRRCVEAAQKYRRVVQSGTQQRSMDHRAQQIAAIHQEKYGKLLVAKGYCCKPRWSIGFKKPTPTPEGLDFNLWLGPAPEQPYNANLVHYNWHWFWDTGNGDIANQGVHELDVARWAIQGATLPCSVWSLGGRFGYKDQGQTPNTLLSIFDFDGVPLVFETRGLVGKDKRFPLTIKNEFFTTEGVIRDSDPYQIEPFTFYPNGGGKPEPVQGDRSVRVTPGGPFGSFIAAIRSRAPKDINATVEDGHFSAALGHLGNISYRLGKPVAFNAKQQSLGDNKEVVRSFEAIQENLQSAGVQLDETSYTLGRTLAFDAKTEKFVDDAEADALLTREYRKPFVVPNQV